MACGLPAIACATRGPAEIVRDGESGWLVPADDESALTAALLEAATDAHERRRRGRQAAADARRRYSWSTIAAYIAGLYEEIITPRGQTSESRAPTRRLRTAASATGRGGLCCGCQSTRRRVRRWRAPEARLRNWLAARPPSRYQSAQGSRLAERLIRWR